MPLGFIYPKKATRLRGHAPVIYLILHAPVSECEIFL
jgi:hypothetical protein